jgi:hypothetical protein
MRNAVTAFVSDPGHTGFEIGAVLFSDAVLAAVAPAPDNGAAIVAAITRSTQNMTCTSCGLARAATMLAASTTVGPHLAILLTDGQPNTGGGMTEARTAAEELVAEGGSIATILVGSGCGSTCATFLSSISGTPASFPDPTLAYAAMSGAEILAALESITDSSLWSTP